MKLPMTLAALAVTVAAGLATAAPAGAAVTSASLTDTTATLNLDDANDNVTVSVSDGLLVHGQTTGGLNSGADWNSTKDGDQTVPANGAFTVVVNGGGGDDALTVVAKDTEIFGALLNGDGGDDTVIGANSRDILFGGEGNDRLLGGQGDDMLNGGAGNDTFVWNNGDGSDRQTGDGGNDLSVVNGAPTAGDAFTLDPAAPPAVPGSVLFKRVNLKTFSIESATERFQVNGLGGDDLVGAGNGVGALTQLSVDGGEGNDTVDGSDGPDLILGGEGNDVLNGRGGDDRIIGDRGSDALNGGAGDDTLVWNNGDGSDVVNGDAGRDDVEVNGAPTAGDTFTIQPNDARIKFDRTNLVPFTLDIGSSESLHANGLGGDDTIAIGDLGAFAVTAAGGSGNDTLTGGASSETFLGGSGNDTITPGGGIDFVSGDEGDDQVNVRDNTADVAFGGDGYDTVLADNAHFDVLDGFESVDRTPDAAPPPGVVPPHRDAAALPLKIGRGTVKVSKGVASVKVSCPAASPASCVGKLAVRAAVGARFAGLKAVVQLGSVRYDVAPGASATLKVRLAKGSRRLASSNGRLKAVAVASAAGTTAQSSQRLALALGSATARRG